MLTSGGRTQVRREGRASRRAFAYRPKIAGGGRDRLVEALLQHAVEKRFGERTCQFDSRTAIAAFAAIKSDGEGDAARPCRIAAH